MRRFFENDSATLSYYGAVKAKERPRSGKGGRMYTPAATRKFEGDVRRWAKENWDRKPLAYPIRVDLMIHEFSDIPELVLHSLWGLVYNQKGDVDNLGKSILDGMNGVVYKDDKQIVDLRITRKWATYDGFDVIIERAGLTPLEYRNFKARMK